MQLIDGRAIAKKIRKEIKEKVAALNERLKLAVVLVGDDPASGIYVRNKEKACEEAGIDFEKVVFPKGIRQELLLKEIEKLNEDEKVSGILVQLPLPKGLNSEEILERISPRKDVDCLNSANFEFFMKEGLKVDLMPVTALATKKIIEHEKIETKGKRAVVVGDSKICGLPIARFLKDLGAEVVICNKETKNLRKETLEADILVSAVGKIGLIGEDMLKSKIDIIDVGISLGKDGKVHGDVRIEHPENFEGKITPVPGGVGPVTVACLLENLLNIQK